VAEGRGLGGLSDRVAVAGGRLTLTSTTAGTTVHAALPLAAA
jgi:signal transduction histidine kinase